MKSVNGEQGAVALATNDTPSGGEGEGMSIRDDFERAFEEAKEKFIGVDYEFNGEDEVAVETFDQEGLALWAAKWMAERVQQESHICLEDGKPCGHINIEIVRNLAKELDGEKV